MLKKKVIPIEKTTIKLKCGDCLHFKRTPKFEKVCSTMGVKHYANAPSCFDPDVYQLASQDPEILSRLGLWLKDLTAKDSRILMAVLKRTSVLEKTYKLKFGQPVMFCLGSSYLSNFFKGFVLSASDGTESQVYITSTLNKRQRKQPLIATLDRESVFTASEFKKHREKLTKDGRVQDPNPLFSPTPSTPIVESTYVIPSMDKAEAHWFDKVQGPKGKKKVAKRPIDAPLTFKVKTKA